MEGMERKHWAPAWMNQSASVEKKNVFQSFEHWRAQDWVITIWEYSKWVEGEEQALMKPNALQPIGRTREHWTCLLWGKGVGLAWGELRAQKFSSMITSWSSVVISVVSMEDGDTLAEELWVAAWVEDPGRVDEVGDGVESGMQVTRFDFPSAWMMIVVLLVCLPKWTKYKTRITRVVAIRQAKRHTRNVFQSDHGFAVTCNEVWKIFQQIT